MERENDRGLAEILRVDRHDYWGMLTQRVKELFWGKGVKQDIRFDQNKNLYLNSESKHSDTLKIVETKFTEQQVEIDGAGNV